MTVPHSQTALLVCPPAPWRKKGSILLASDPNSLTHLPISSLFVFHCEEPVFLLMGSGDLLEVQPSELKFPFELKKSSSCVMQLNSKTDQYVAFKVKTTNPRKYSVRPNIGIVAPGSTCNVTVTMQAPKEVPPDLQCKDKFLIQFTVANAGATQKDVTSDMFNKELGKVVEECKLRVLYIPANPPSPVPEEAEDSPSPGTSIAENGNQSSSLFDAVARRLTGANKEKDSETSALVAKLTNERNSVIQMNQKLHQDLDLLRKENRNRQKGGFSFTFVALVCLLSILIGYLLKQK